ncbi:hypothetical protein GOBAR_AA01639 [Gossypium barbadense]|uniref:Uncharacterized protein n=1 Tax=Gossypium barbadense TaxID=3634 RepID=A0A2P5YTM4_GOSBA|nr:hypothetical protein GOBAR_AA01639 [Gossypium barbadense]
MAAQMPPPWCDFPLRMMERGYEPQARAPTFDYSYPNEAGYGFGLAGGSTNVWFGFASGPPDVCGPYTRPFFRREVQRDLGRELGRDLGQRRVRPFAIVHRPPHAGHSLGQNSGPSSG